MLFQCCDTLRGMPRKVQTSGEPDELVPLHFNVPLALKRLALARAKAEGLTLTDWLRQTIRKAAQPPKK